MTKQARRTPSRPRWRGSVLLLVLGAALAGASGWLGLTVPHPSTLEELQVDPEPDPDREVEERCDGLMAHIVPVPGREIRQPRRVLTGTYQGTLHMRGPDEDGWYWSTITCMGQTIDVHAPTDLSGSGRFELDADAVGAVIVGSCPGCEEALPAPEVDPSDTPAARAARTHLFGMGLGALAALLLGTWWLLRAFDPLADLAARLGPHVVVREPPSHERVRLGSLEVAERFVFVKDGRLVGANDGPLRACVSVPGASRDYRRGTDLVRVFGPAMLNGLAVPEGESWALAHGDLLELPGHRAVPVHFPTEGSLLRALLEDPDTLRFGARAPVLGGMGRTAILLSLGVATFVVLHLDVTGAMQGAGLLAAAALLAASLTPPRGAGPQSARFPLATVRSGELPLQLHRVRGVGHRITVGGVTVGWLAEPSRRAPPTQRALHHAVLKELRALAAD